MKRFLSWRAAGTLLGILGILGLGGIYLLSYYQDHWVQVYVSEAETSPASGQLAFDYNDLIYRGNGDLNLMEGVHAWDLDGSDITDQVNAVITGRGTRTSKIVRYSVFTSDGQELTGERNLIMEDYTGPSLSVSDPLYLQAEDFANLGQVLWDRGDLLADDGFERDITDRVTWERERISPGVYRITFSVTNGYLDSAQTTAEANVTGELSDIVLTLTQNRVELPVGAEFLPWSYVEQALDSSGGQDISSQLQINSNVNMGQPGTYSVVYTLYSLDGTQVARQLLNVVVTGA